MLRSNQKEILRKHIADHLASEAANSLLDIGAGDGKVSVDLRADVSDYLAVEKHAGSAKRLKILGLPVKEGQFPCELSREFDVVLVSHSLPEDFQKLDRFIKSAWNVTAQGGVLIIISFKGGAGTISKISEFIWGKAHIHDSYYFSCLLAGVSKLGTPKLERFLSRFSAGSIEELVNLISGNLAVELGSPERLAIQNYVQEFCKNGPEYYIDCEHTCISLRK